MERKPIFLVLFSAFITCFFVACSNDSDALDINAIDVKAGTRSAGLSSYMTREEIQDRLDEIGEKYGKTILLTDDTDTRKITEEFFTWVENSYKNEIGKKITEFGASIIDDEQINEVEIPEIGTYASPGEVNSYTGTISKDHNYQYWDGKNNYEDWVKVIITWYANTGGGENKVTAELVEVVVSNGHNYRLTGFSHSPIVGDVSNPGFSYMYTIVASNGVHYNYAGMK